MDGVMAFGIDVCADNLYSSTAATIWQIRMVRLLLLSLLATLLVHKSLASFVFSPKCNRSLYNIVPSNTSLALPASRDEVIDSIMSPMAGSTLSRQDSFLEMYRQGLQRCEEHSRTLDTEVKAPSVRPRHIFNEAAGGLHGGCRGRKLLRDLTGLTVWPFGPVDTCTTHSTCWYDLLLLDVDSLLFTVCMY